MGRWTHARVLHTYMGHQKRLAISYKFICGPAAHCRNLIVELCPLHTATVHCHKPEQSNPHPQPVSLRSISINFYMSSTMWRLKYSTVLAVSQELVRSIIRVCSYTPRKAEAGSSGTFITICWTMWHHIPQSNDLYSNCPGNLTYRPFNIILPSPIVMYPKLSLKVFRLGFLCSSFLFHACRLFCPSYP